MDNLFTWQALTTLAGAAGITDLIVAYTKRIIDIFIPPAIGTDLYAVVVGFVVLLCAITAIGERITFHSVVLAFFNGFLVAATAGKMHNKAGE